MTDNLKKGNEMSKKVLVVEDEEALLKAISIKMAKMGNEVLAARSVREAKEHLSHTHPDLIWLDHYLYGEQSGLDLLKELKSKDETKNIPVIVVSNTCTNDKYHDYIELGINNYYVKSSVRLDQIITEAMAI